MNARAANPAEALVAWTIRATWPFYFLGALYAVGPVIAWVLAGLAALSLYLGPAMRPDLRVTGSIPPVIWGWITGMLVMLVVLWIGHLDWSLGIGATIKSTIGWAKGWAMLALFPLAGAVLPLRRAPIIRAQCVVALWTLCLLPIFLAAPFAGLPSVIFVSPLKMVGGPGPEYFTVFLYILDPATWTPRWSFYAPWCPFAGLLGVVMVLFALEERDKRWMLIGILGGVAMILLSKSRMSIVALVVCSIGPRMMPLLLRAWAWGLASVAITSLAALGVPLLNLVSDAVDRFKNARADSTRVRATLQRIAEDRWRNEAVLFGHGTVEPGPHLVEYMPIGSHHTWFGLLFVKGAVGLIALLVPMIWQLSIALVDAARGARGRLPLGIMLVLVVLSFGENIEIEVYLLWPALLILGIHARELRQGTALS
ncbi:MAG: O-antigen ligase domain-containing protein [Pseudomonadota bacterium]